MTRIDLLRTVSANPMGAQFYEAQVVDALLKLPGFSLQDHRVGGLKSPLDLTDRLPMRVIEQMGPRAARALGGMMWPRRTLVHRMDLRLPPARRELVTVLDLAPLHFSDEGTMPRFALASASRALGALCLSEHSAAEARDVLGVTKTWVAPPGVDERFFEAVSLSAETRARLGLPGPYVLHAGGATRRKGLDLLAECWPALYAERPELTLALCGPQHPNRDRLFQGMAGVRRLGRQPAALLPSLMASAELVVVPSRYEGWGMPAAEALATGTAVVACRTSSLPEVVGDLGILVRPAPEDLGDALLSFFDRSPTHSSSDRQMQARRYTWQAAADVHAQAYQEAS